MSTQVATIQTGETERFNLMQREAKLFSASPLIPAHLRQGGPEQAMANCYIALKLARTMGEDPLVVLQNIHVVNGKAGFATQYMIARANAAGIFHGRIDWRIDRTDPNNLSVTAFATLKDTGQEVSVTCDMRMAIAEGWTKNPKYKSMPEVMLRYRSAAFLVRFYAPDVMLGYQTAEEVEDVAIARGPDLNATPLTAKMLTDQAAGVDEKIVEHEEAPNDGTLAPDNPAATEGRAESGMGEAHNEPSDDEIKANAFIERLSAATVIGDVIAVERELQAVQGTMAFDQVQRVDEALAAARKRFGK